MNWNNIPNIKFKIYDPELKQFFAGSDAIAPKINSGGNVFKDKHKNRYYICYNESGLIFGFDKENGDWDECKIFPWSGYTDPNGTELYLYDKVKHTDANEWKGVIDIEDGRWVIRYDSQRTALLKDRVEYIRFVGDPDPDC